MPVMTDPRINSAPASLDARRQLPGGFFDFLLSLHREFTPRQQALVARRAEALADAHLGRLPQFLPPSEATTGDWRIELPAWCADQRNQMTGPADDAELVVKMLNSGAPGVMLDLEDSNANACCTVVALVAIPATTPTLHTTRSREDLVQLRDVDNRALSRCDGRN